MNSTNSPAAPLATGVWVTGIVKSVRKSVSSKPYNGKMTYVHHASVIFDDCPGVEITCSWMHENPQSDYLRPDEPVRLLRKNFLYNNYGIQKDESYQPVSAVAQNSEFVYAAAAPNSSTVPADLIVKMMGNAIMGAATYAQYKDGIDKAEYYEMVDELFTQQMLKYEMKSPR